MKLEWTKMTAIVIFFNIKKSKQEKERGEREEGESGKLNLKRTDVYVCYIYLCTCVCGVERALGDRPLVF